MTSSPKSRSHYPFTSVSSESTRRQQRLPWLIVLFTIIPALIMLSMLRGSSTPTSTSTSTPDAESLSQAPLRTYMSHPTKQSIDPAPWNGADVVPDLLPLLPSDVAAVSFGDILVQPGVHVPTAIAAKQPSISWPSTGSEYYTVLMFDPDAPSRAKPTHADWLHWCVVNVRGNDLKTGDVLAEYAGPTPPKGTGPHRYVLVIYASHEPQDTKKWGKTIKADSHEGRANYHHDTKTPIAAANFFIAEYDEGKK